MTAPVLVWFRRDLRLEDHPALAAAVAAGAPVVPVYVYDEASDAKPATASYWWLRRSLAALDDDLAAKGNRLVVRVGPTAAALTRLAGETGARALHVTWRHEPAQVALEAEVDKALQAAGVACHPSEGALIRPPDTLATAEGRPYRVFTPFHRAFLAADRPAGPRPAPSRIPPIDPIPASDPLPAPQAEPDEAWRPGAAAAAARLDAFLTEVVDRYAADRDRPDRAATSRLSPHLHFGEISPRAVWHRLVDNAAAAGPGPEAFLRQLAWREFSYHLLHHFPALPEAPLRPEFAAFAWQGGADDLERWRRGETGYPIVDAAMRDLRATGWLHNRLRMVVASFLTKHLLIRWQDGAAWFLERLVDADLANNSAGWQWVAGCGTDAAPYFRIFNPVLQGEKFDPDGTYVRRWLPELADVETSLVHKPGAAGRAPLVDHASARKRALAAFEEIKSGK